MLDIVIIGAGPIGIYASHLAALHNLNGVLLEARDNVGGQLTNLYPDKDIIDVPGFERVTARGLIEQFIKQRESKENKLPIHLMESVSNFQEIEGGYEVITPLETYQTKTILIVSGMGTFTPRKIGLENEDNFKNIAYAVKDKNAYQGKKVVVLGGGDSAVDLTLMLEKLTSEISIIHRREEFRAQGSSVDELKASSAKIYIPYVPTKLIGEGDKLTAIEISKVDASKKIVPDTSITIELDNLIVNYGLISGPNKFELEKTGPYINVKDCYQTSKDNIFAIGNCVNYPGKVRNITCGLGEAVVAITKIDQLVHPGKNIPIHF